MHFEGDTCSLSFGFHTRTNRVKLLGTLWPHQATATATDETRPNVRFSTEFSEAEVQALQQWLQTGSNGAITLPEPLQLARRTSPDNSNPLSFEIQFCLPEIPDWWQWDTAFPLHVHVDVQQREFEFLVQSLDQQHWLDN